MEAYIYHEVIEVPL
ncbi:hypothetical protein CFC21_036280, partial [Triticum aestivum]